MTSWGEVLYVVVVSGLITAAAAACEAVLRGVGRQARGVWLVAGLSSAGLILVPPAVPQPGEVVVIEETAGGAVPLAAFDVAPEVGTTTPAAPAPRSGWSERARLLLATPLPAGAGVAWMLGSVALGLAWLFGWLALRVRARDWPRIRVDGRRVLVSRDFGPAAVGLFGGSIVMPAWALSLDRERRGVVLDHEAEHLAARDLPLLALSGALVAAVPWNPLLWLQAGRMAAAVELDCDLRVVRRLGDRRRYGRILLSLARDREARGDGTMATASVGLHGAVLRRRVEHLVQKGASRGRTGAGFASASVAALLACAVPTPAVSPEVPAEAEYVGARTSDPWSLGRLAGGLSSEPALEGAVGEVALAIWTGADGRRVVRIDGTAGPAVTTAAVDAAVRLAGTIDLVGMAEEPREGWVPVWVLYLPGVVEAHLIRPELYGEKGWPADRASLKRHMELVRRLRSPTFELPSELSGTPEGPRMARVEPVAGPRPGAGGEDFDPSWAMGAADRIARPGRTPGPSAREAEVELLPARGR